LKLNYKIFITKTRLNDNYLNKNSKKYDFIKKEHKKNLTG